MAILCLAGSAWARPDVPGFDLAIVRIAAGEEVRAVREPNARHDPGLARSRSWPSRVNDAIARHKRYPPSLREAARAAGRPLPPGRVVLRFAIDRDGRVVSLSVKSGSGVPELDEAALAMVRRAAPLPPPPPEVTGETVDLELPVIFRDDE